MTFQILGNRVGVSWVALWGHNGAWGTLHTEQILMKVIYYYLLLNSSVGHVEKGILTQKQNKCAKKPPQNNRKGMQTAAKFK